MEAGVRFKIAILTVLALAGLACNREQKRRIAVIPKGTAHVFWQSVHAGAVSAGQDLKVEIMWDGPPSETDYSRQLEIFDSMMNRHVDGVVVAASDKNMLNGSLDRAARDKTPVVVFDSGVDSTNYVSFVATNNYKAGRMAGRKLGELLGGKGKVAMIQNAPGSFSTMERERGFKEAISQDFPGIQFVAEQYSMSNRAKGMSATENILTAHPDLNGLFASSEPSAVGAAQAVKSRGLAGKLKFVGFDASEGMLEDLNGGVFDALVVQDPFQMGYQAVKAVVDKLNGKTPEKQIDLPAVTVVKADLEKPEIKLLLHPDLKKYLGQ